jgi:hypothetical protein
MSKAQAQTKKNEGNDFFKAKNYEQAIAKYTEVYYYHYYYYYDHID